MANKDNNADTSSTSEMTKEETRNLYFIAETYLGRNLTPTEQETLLHLVNDYGMSADLIDYLLEYCVSRNHTSFHYIEKVAQNWAERGFRTVKDVREQSCRNAYSLIFEAYGIKNRNPTPTEIEYVNRWLYDFAMPVEVIQIACQKTIQQTGKAQIRYTDSIMRSWYENNVHSTADVENLERAYTEERRRKMPSGAPSIRMDGTTDKEACLSGPLTDEEATIIAFLRQADPETKSLIRHLLQYIRRR